MERTEAAFVLAQALMVAAVLALLILPLNSANLTSVSSTTASSATVSSLASLSSSPGLYQVLQQNLTIHGTAACVPVEFSGLSCPPDPSLENVDVISYQGNRLYGINFTIEGPGSPSVQTVWFTPGYVVCASPQVSGYESCPTHPVEPAFYVPVSTTSTLNSSSGLRLDLALSANSSWGLEVKLDEYNTLDGVNNVTAADHWVIPPASLLDDCFSSMVGFAVYNGTYGVGNFTQGTPLALIDPGGGSCNMPPPEPCAHYSFFPLGDEVANLPSDNFIHYYSSFSRISISVSDVVRGYWTGSSAADWTFHPFPPGTYTLVAADEWGNAASLTFDSEGISLQNFGLCPSNCIYPSPYLYGEIYVHSHAPLKSLQLFVNGTDQGVRPYDTNATGSYIYMYKGSFQTPKAVAGDAYTIKFVAVFADNSTSTATTTFVAEG